MKLGDTWEPLSEINVTPFVDVMLVLLIIFMVSAPFLDQGITVALPRAETSKDVTGSDLVIVLSREHVIYLEKEALTLQELRQRLEKVEKNRSILIKSDEHAYVKRLVELWDTCRALSFREIHIATQYE